MRLREQKRLTHILGLRLVLEWQRISSCYTDDANQYTNLPDELYAHNIPRGRWVQPTHQPPDGRVL